MLKLSGEHRTNVAKEDLIDIDIHKLYTLCKEHELAGVVAAHILADGNIELPEFWQTTYLAEKERLAFLKEKSNQICEKMKQNNIPMIILKNGGIMSDIVADPAACPMEDIDSLVRKEDFFKAHQLLLDCGFVFKFRSEFEKEILDEAFVDGSTEYYIPMPNGEKMWFELSWRAIAGRWIRPDKEPDTNELFERFYYAPNSSVGILSPEDNLLQVCIHTAKHSYVRSPGLRLHLDVERIVTHKEIDWNLFLAGVEQAHVKTSTYYSLLIPKTLFGTEVPEWILERLKPGKAKATRIEKMLAHAQLLHPSARKFSKLAFLKFQTALYDNIGDAWKVLYPSWKWYQDKYHTPRILLPWCLLLRGGDLMGIRKKKEGA